MASMAMTTSSNSLATNSSYSPRTAWALSEETIATTSLPSSPPSTSSTTSSSSHHHGPAPMLSASKKGHSKSQEIGSSSSGSGKKAKKKHRSSSVKHSKSERKKHAREHHSREEDHDDSTGVTPTDTPVETSPNHSQVYAETGVPEDSKDTPAVGTGYLPTSTRDPPASSTVAISSPSTSRSTLGLSPVDIVELRPSDLVDEDRKRSPKEDKKRRSRDKSSSKLKPVVGSSVSGKVIPIFESGFLLELESGVFSDVTVRVVSPSISRDFKLHRLVLAKNSSYFRLKLINLSPGDVCELPLQEEGVKVFPVILRYFYSGAIDCTIENGVASYYLAVLLGIPELEKAVMSFLFQTVSRDCAWDLLIQLCSIPIPTTSSSSKASANEEESLPKFHERCLDIVAKNFSQTYAGITKLPPELVIDLLSRNNLAVKSELVVYKAVVEYLQSLPEDRAEQWQAKLFETIRFPLMNTDELKLIEKDKAVPPTLLSEALMQKLKKVEGQGSINPKWQPRQTQAISLEYKYDFDQGGVLYYIGTKRYQEPWANPSLRGRIRVSSSTTSIEKGKVTDICEREPTECWTNNHPSSWFSINLGSQRALVPNYYTLRHGGNSKNDCLRNWTLQGSYDGRTWEVLSRHVNDTSLIGPFATHSWPLSCHRSYRLFKIVQTGRNSSHSNFLSLSGFEIYGDLYETKYVLQNGYGSP